MIKVRLSNWLVRSFVPSVLTFFGKVARTPAANRAAQDADDLRNMAPATDEASSIILLDAMSAKLEASTTANKLAGK
jgi:hypothetical protein